MACGPLDPPVRFHGRPWIGSHNGLSDTYYLRSSNRRAVHFSFFPFCATQYQRVRMSDPWRARARCASPGAATWIVHRTRTGTYGDVAMTSIRTRDRARDCILHQVAGDQLALGHAYAAASANTYVEVGKGMHVLSFFLKL